MEGNDPIQWINTVLQQMRRIKGDEAIIALENCGRKCLKSSNSHKTIENLRNNVNDKEDIDLLFHTYKEKIYENRPNLYQKSGKIYLEYHKCGCEMVTKNGVSDPFLCNCTVGYTKQIFETLFAKPVRVKLLASILNGDPICKQEIAVKIV